MLSLSKTVVISALLFLVLSISVEASGQGLLGDLRQNLLNSLEGFFKKVESLKVQILADCLGIKILADATIKALLDKLCVTVNQGLKIKVDIVEGILKHCELKSILNLPSDKLMKFAGFVNITEWMEVEQQITKLT